MSPNRTRGLPRSSFLLGGLLIVAVVALVFMLRSSGPTDFTLGGPLFEIEAERIDGILVTKQGQQIRLDRHENGLWSLGGAVRDHVQQNAVAELLGLLTAAQGTAVLAGTEPEDRRFEFNGPESVRLTLFAGDEEPTTLVLGTTNPVNNYYYASGAGRSGCFLVTAGLRQKLWKLPVDVQARTLLPEVAAVDLTGVTIRRGDREHDLQKIEGRWWLEIPPEGPGYFGPIIADYLTFYGDRWRRDGGRDWVLADAAGVGNLVYEVSSTIVRRILPPAEGEPLMESWGLAPPLREVVLRGPGVNPDPTATDPDLLAIALGVPLGAEGLPALRRGNALLTDLQAQATLENPVGLLAHRLALDLRPLDADVLELEREGTLILRGERTGQAMTGEGREAWVTTVPVAGLAGVNEKTRGGFARDVVVNLGRMPILKVLPPSSDPQLLRERERLKVTLTYGTGSEARPVTFLIGFLDPALLDIDPLVEQGDPVGLYFPESGKLLQVPDSILVTARNLASLKPAD